MNQKPMTKAIEDGMGDSNAPTGSETKMIKHEEELAKRLAAKMSADYAQGDFAFTPIYYMRSIALDLLRELAESEIKYGNIYTIFSLTSAPSHHRFTQWEH